VRRSQDGIGNGNELCACIKSGVCMGWISALPLRENEHISPPAGQSAMDFTLIAEDANSRTVRRVESKRASVNMDGRTFCDIGMARCSALLLRTVRIWIAIIQGRSVSSRIKTHPVFLLILWIKTFCDMSRMVVSRWRCFNGTA
jgi:hypothetical protein